MWNWGKWRRERKARKLVDDTLGLKKSNGDTSAELLEQVGHELDQRAFGTLSIFGTFCLCIMRLYWSHANNCVCCLFVIVLMLVTHILARVYALGTSM